MGFLAGKTGNAINSDTLNLTRLSGVGAALVALGVSVEPVVKRIVGEDASPAVKAAILIAAIAAWAAIAVADMIARSYAEAHKRRLTATVTPGADDADNAVLAVRFEAAGSGTPAFLLLKKGTSPRWVQGSDLTIDPDGTIE